MIGMDGIFLAFASRLLLDKWQSGLSFPLKINSKTLGKAKARNVLDRFLVEPAAVGLVETTHGAEKTQQVQHVWMWSVSHTKTALLGKWLQSLRSLSTRIIGQLAFCWNELLTVVPSSFTCRERSYDAQLFLTSSKQAGTMKHQQSFIGTKSTCGASMWA